MLALRSIAADKESAARRECGGLVRAGEGRGEAGECDSRRHGFWRGGGGEETSLRREGDWEGFVRKGRRCAGSAPLGTDAASRNVRTRPSSHFCPPSPAYALPSSHRYGSQFSHPYHRRVQVHCHSSRVSRARWLSRCRRGLGLAATKILLTEFNAKVVALSRSETVELTELRQRHADSLLITKGDVLVLWSLRHTSTYLSLLHPAQTRLSSPPRLNLQCRHMDISTLSY